MMENLFAWNPNGRIEDKQDCSNLIFFIRCLPATKEK